MPPPQDFMNQQAAQQLLQGMNAMQMRAGMMPGGVPQMGGGISPPIMGGGISPQIMSGMGMAPTMGAIDTRQQRPMITSAAQQLQQRQMQEQQLMSTMISPPPIMGGGVSPMARPGQFGQFMQFPQVNLPGPQFGTGRLLNRQRVQGEANQMIAGTQAAGGVAARLAGGFIAGGGPAGMLTPGMGIGGMLGFEASGMGQATQGAANKMMDPLVMAREQALRLQNQSMNFVRGGGDAAAGGVGLSTSAATRLQSSLMRMTDSKAFGEQTGERFNRQDVMKITRLSGEMGMLDQSQTADQIRVQVGKISRALHNFMKIAEEPDVQNAMRMMSQLRQSGFTVPESQVAVQNARTFARMAGTSTQGIMGMAEGTANMFQQMGMSRGAGLTAGMAAGGMAGIMSRNMTPSQMGVMGGQQGMQQALAGGMAKGATNDIFLTAALTRRNGQLAVSPEALLESLDPNMGVQDIARRAGRNIQRFGGREFAGEFSTRQNELRDEMQRMLGPQGQVLVNLIRAQQVSKTTGMSLGASLRAMGLEQNEARAAELIYNSPQAQQDFRRQIERQKIDMRQQIEEQRKIVDNRVSDRLEQRMIGTGIGVAAGFMTGGAGAAIMGGFTGQRQARGIAHEVGRAGRQFGAGVDRFATLAAERGDVEEEMATRGGDLIRSVSRARYTTEADRRQMRDRIKRMDVEQLDTFFQDPDPTGMPEQVQEAMRESRARRAQGPGGVGFLDAIGVGGLVGAEGLGLTEAQRGGLRPAQLVRRHQGLIDTVKLRRRSGAEVQRRMSDMKATGRIFEFSQKASRRERVELTNKMRNNLPKEVDQESFDDSNADAAAELNAYLEDQITLGRRTGEISIEAFKSQQRAKMQREGKSQSEIDVVLSAENLQNIADLGKQSRSPEAEKGLRAAVQAGGEADALERGNSIARTRKEAEDLQESALKSIGVKTGFFGTTDEARKAVLRSIAGSTTGKGGLAVKAKQLLLQRNALAAAAKQAPAGSEKRKQLEKQAVALETKARALGSEAYGAGETELRAAFRGVDEEAEKDALLGIAGALAGKTPDEAAKLLAGAGEAAGAAARQTAREGLVKLFGVEGAETITSEGTIAGLKNLLEREQITDPRMRRLAEKAVAGSRAALRQITTEAELAGETGQIVKGGGGLTQAGQEQGLVERLMGAAFGGGGARGGVAPGGDFAAAVPKFAEASEALLEASKNFAQEDSLISLRGIINSGSVLGNLLGIGQD